EFNPSRGPTHVDGKHTERNELRKKGRSPGVIKETRTAGQSPRLTSGGEAEASVGAGSRVSHCSRCSQPLSSQPFALSSLLFALTFLLMMKLPWASKSLSLFHQSLPSWFLERCPPVPQCQRSSRLHRQLVCA